VADAKGRPGRGRCRAGSGVLGRPRLDQPVRWLPRAGGWSGLAEAEEANRALTPGSGAGRPWDGEPADEGSEDAWSLTVRLLLVGAGWGLV